MSAPRQFLVFASVGAFGTAIHFLTLYVFVSQIGLNAGVSAAIGATLGAVINYVLNHRVTFRSGRSHVETAPRFLLLAAGGVVANGILVEAIVRVGLHYLLAQALATVFILAINFAVSRKWIFLTR